MKEIEVTAATAEEAWAQALETLGVPAEQAEMEIIAEKTTGGLFGVLGQVKREVTVRVRVRDNRGQEAVERLQTLLDLMNVDADVSLVGENEEEVQLNISGPDLGLVIGSFGQTLNALQLLVNIMINRGWKERRRVVVDAEGYRERRRRSLENLALSSARRAKEEKREVILEDLRAAERRIIHTTLQHDPDVITFSEGEEPHRRLIISPRH